MKHLHKRFTVDQIKLFFSAYLKNRMSRKEIENELDIGKSRFFVLLQQYKKDKDTFSVSYHRHTPTRISASTEHAIAEGLRFDKQLIADPNVPITTYNYSALRDRLRDKQEIVVSLKTIINRAKASDCYQEKRPKASHDREVLTTAIGALIQHDTSLHLWSPYAQSKWVLITSLDDFSRLILYADFVERETTWVHIIAAETVIMTYGYPLRYYVDQLRVFRFIQGRDSIWRKYVLETDDVDPQWRQVMRVCGVDVIYALSKRKERLNGRTGGCRIGLFGHALWNTLRGLKMRGKY